MAVIETSSSPERTIAVCDLHDGSVIRVLRFRDNHDDLVLARVVPREIAETIRDHHTPPPPITAEEKQVMATLDEAPHTEDPYPCDPYAQVCLSVMPDDDAWPWCPDTSGPPPVRRLRCAAAPENVPPPDLLALLLLAAARRRREVIDRLAEDRRLPADVIRRLRGDPTSR